MARYEFELSTLQASLDSAVAGILDNYEVEDSNERLGDELEEKLEELHGVIEEASTALNGLASDIQYGYVGMGEGMADLAGELRNLRATDLEDVVGELDDLAARVEAGEWGGVDTETIVDAIAGVESNLDNAL